MEYEQHAGYAGGGGEGGYSAGGKQGYDAKQGRKAIVRKTVDYNASAICYWKNRVHQRDYRDHHALQFDQAYAAKLMPPLAMQATPVSSISSKFVHTSTNKIKHPINCVSWTPEGRRLITGSSSGEFTLWNGLTFNFETILQAHESAVRSMVWSHNDMWMVTGDHSGKIKYWQSNMNNVKAFVGHKEAVRDISFAPTDLKFVTCSDDVSIKIWDFARCTTESVLTGHGWDIKSVHWHPVNSLLASGSKDNLVKLWDARTAKNITTLHGHKNTVLSVRWNKNGNWLLTASRDQLLKLYDIRTMKEVQSFRGHKREVTVAAWHPIHEDFFASGGFDGSVLFWRVGFEEPKGEIIQAHDGSIWDLAWHPLGHILCSGSNNHTTKFWCRNRPGDFLKDKYNNPNAAAEPDHSSATSGISSTYGGAASEKYEPSMPTSVSATPSNFLPGLSTTSSGIPMIPGISNEASSTNSSQTNTSNNRQPTQPPQTRGPPGGGGPPPSGAGPSSGPHPMHHAPIYIPAPSALPGGVPPHHMFPPGVPPHSPGIGGPPPGGPGIMPIPYPHHPMHHAPPPHHPHYHPMHPPAGPPHPHAYPPPQHLPQHQLHPQHQQQSQRQPNNNKW